MPLLVDTIIPFAPDGHVDLGAIRAHALWLFAQGVDGLVPGGAEFLHVDRKEKERILEVVTDVAGGRTLLVPIWDPSPAYVLKLGRLAAERGATGVLLPPPLLLPAPEDALVDWYRSVALHLTLPLYAWHHPRFGNALTPRLLQRLTTETKVAGVLDASGDLHRLRRIVAAWPGCVWASVDEVVSASELHALTTLPGLAGGVSRLANAWPELVRRAWGHDTLAGDDELCDAVIHRGSAVERAGSAAALKRALGVGSRLPLTGVDEAEFARLPVSSFR
ncbi:MAG: dihydrodipicolinate synthase family protein [Pseudomonadota bacterium]|nr:dihydrodipicolinate synthase family protein [Pseudomonadota bacterium]